MHISQSNLKPSPELNANVFSFLSWFWISPLITLASKKALQPEDLYELNANESTEYCKKRWDEEWMKEYNKNFSTKRALFLCFCKQFCLAALWKPVWLVAVILQVYILKALVKVAGEENEFKLYWGIVLVIGIFCTSMTQSITQHHCFTQSQKVGMKARATVCVAVYKKMLDMNLASISQVTNGIMLNLVTNDTQKLLDAITYSHFVWHSVIELLFICAFAFYEVGVSSLGGIFIVFLTQPIQIFMAKSIGKIRKIAVTCTDSRVRLISETLTGIRVVKFNGLVRYFLTRISNLRATELSWIRKAAFIRSANSTLKDTVTPFASLTTFGIYVILHNGKLSAEKAFTVLALFSIMSRIFFIVPQGLQFCVESMIALQRLRNFLCLPNGNGFCNESEAKKLKDSNPKADMIADVASFHWLSSENQLHFSHFTKKMENIQSSKKGKNNVNGNTISSPKNHEINENQSKKNGFSLKEISFVLEKNEIFSVVGKVGSGKSSLLFALLGEMEYDSGLFYCNKSMAYVPQQPWILNDTIRNNILFGNEFDSSRYFSVVNSCALSHDISLFPFGDETEIGERGVNLSGGQKARISLARACYAQSSIIIMDDPFAAVDVPTASHIMHNVIGGILRDRTVLFVTHNQKSVSYSDRIGVMENGRLRLIQKGDEGVAENELFDREKESERGDAVDDVFNREKMNGVDSIDDGLQGVDMEKELKSSEEVKGMSIEEQGRVKKRMIRNELHDHGDDAYKLNGSMDDDVSIHNDREVSNHDNNNNENNDIGKERVENVNGEKSDKISTENGLKIELFSDKSTDKDMNLRKKGSITVKEDRVEGVISKKTYIDYIRNSGSLVKIILLIFLFLISQTVRTYVDYWLGVWVDRKYGLTTGMYVAIYGILTCTACLLSLARAFLFTHMSITSSSNFHEQMLKRVLNAPLIFFDQNPVGRILNRFSKDQSLIDELLPFTAQVTLELMLGSLGSIAIIGALIPWFLLTLPFLLSLFLILQRQYTQISRELKRLDGISRSPIYAHFSQSLQGVASIRAYGAKNKFIAKYMSMIDENHRAYILFVHTGRWLGVRLDLCSALCVTVTGLCVVLLRKSIPPGIAGVVLVQSLQLTGFLQYGVRQAAETENYFTSVERIHAYTQIETEKDKKVDSAVPIPQVWPSLGEIAFQNLTLAYRSDLPPVLNDISFTVNSGEKIGILGRTGSGKSSLVSALFRLVDNESCSGKIVIDGIDIHSVPLDRLRQSISMIPQDPVLFQGTMRQNLDPFGSHSDDQIYSALDHAKLSDALDPTSRLETKVSENGENFSVGQRQLLCLARALLRKSKVIVMDEATAAIDNETDEIIQATMRENVKGCTVLTIAHRINTIIDYDRVLVLDTGGRIAEYDSPASLLRKQKNASIFAAMVDRTGSMMREKLRRSAEDAESKRRAK